MTSNFNRFVGGMLAGGGAGLQKVGANRIEQEREKARRLHDENMARFNSELATDRQDDQNKFTEGRDKAKSEQVVRTVDSIVDNKPVTIQYDANGKQVGEPIPRSFSATELKAQGIDGDPEKYDNSLHDDARTIINERFASEVFAGVLGEGDASTKMDSFMIQNQVTGVKELNMALVRANYPEVAKKYDILKMTVEEGLKTNKNPQQVVESAFQKINTATDVMIEKERQKLVEKYVKISGGMKTEDVEALMTKQFSPAEIDKMSQQFDPNDPQSKLLKEVQPNIYEQVIVKAKKNEEIAKTKETSVGGKEGQFQMVNGQMVFLRIGAKKHGMLNDPPAPKRYPVMNQYSEGMLE